MPQANPLERLIDHLAQQPVLISDVEHIPSSHTSLKALSDMDTQPTATATKKPKAASIHRYGDKEINRYTQLSRRKQLDYELKQLGL